jgi:hypothetical protein
VLNTVVGGGLVLVAWLAVATRLPAVARRPAPPALRAYWLSLLALALALSVQRPAVYLLIDAGAGIPNLARLLGDALVVASAWAVQVFLYHLYFPGARATRASRRSGVLFVGTLLLLGVLFAAAPVDEEALAFARRYADAPFVLEYRLVLLAYVGFALIHLAGPAWRYAGLAEGAVLRLGLRLVALGAALGLVAVALEGCRALGPRLGAADIFVQAELPVALLTAGAIGCILLGATMPEWGNRMGIAVVARWVERYLACRRLYALWRALYAVNPGIALLPPTSAWRDAITARDLGFRLYRRVVEIHDGCLELRPYMDQRVVEYAEELCRERRLNDQETAIVVTAARLACAVRAQAEGRVARRPAANPTGPDAADLAMETVYLTRVARYYERSPLVRAVAAYVERDRVDDPVQQVQGAGQRGPLR